MGGAGHEARRKRRPGARQSGGFWCRQMAVCAARVCGRLSSSLPEIQGGRGGPWRAHGGDVPLAPLLSRRRLSSSSLLEVGSPAHSGFLRRRLVPCGACREHCAQAVTVLPPSQESCHSASIGSGAPRCRVLAPVCYLGLQIVVLVTQNGSLKFLSCNACSQCRLLFPGNAHQIEEDKEHSNGRPQQLIPTALDAVAQPPLHEGYNGGSQRGSLQLTVIHLLSHNVLVPLVRFCVTKFLSYELRTKCT